MYLLLLTDICWEKWLKDDLKETAYQRQGAKCFVVMQFGGKFTEKCSLTFCFIILYDALCIPGPAWYTSTETSSLDSYTYCKILYICYYNLVNLCHTSFQVVKNGGKSKDDPPPTVSFTPPPVVRGRTACGMNVTKVHACMIKTFNRMKKRIGFLIYQVHYTTSSGSIVPDFSMVYFCISVCFACHSSVPVLHGSRTRPETAACCRRQQRTDQQPNHDTRRMHQRYEDCFHQNLPVTLAYRSNWVQWCTYLLPNAYSLFLTGTYDFECPVTLGFISLDPNEHMKNLACRYMSFIDTDVADLGNQFKTCFEGIVPAR